MSKKMRRRLRKAGERMQPGFGGSIGQPEGTIRTSDFRDSDGDGTDDRDQRRPGGRNIVEKRRRKASKQPGYRNGDRVSIPTPPPSYGGGPGRGNEPIGGRPPMRPQPSPGMPPRAPEARPPMRPQPTPVRGGRPNRPQPYPGMPPRAPRNRKGRDRKIRGGGREPGFNLNDIMDRFNSGGNRPNRFMR